MTEITIRFPAGENQVFSDEAFVGNLFRNIRVSGELAVITDIEIIDEGKMALITIRS